VSVYNHNNYIQLKNTPLNFVNLVFRTSFFLQNPRIFR